MNSESGHLSSAGLEAENMKTGLLALRKLKRSGVAYSKQHLNSHDFAEVATIIMYSNGGYVVAGEKSHFTIPLRWMK